MFRRGRPKVKKGVKGRIYGGVEAWKAFLQRPPPHWEFSGRVRHQKYYNSIRNGSNTFTKL